MVPNRNYSYYNITWLLRYRKNIKICVDMDIIPFAVIVLMSTHIIWIFLMQVQENRSIFGLNFSFISVFGTLEIWSYVIWYYSMLPISEKLSITLWPRNGYKLVHCLIIFRDISPRWGTVCPLPDKMNTWSFRRNSLPMIISLSVLLVTIVFPVWYSPLQIVQIQQTLVFRMSIWLILW